MVRLGETRDYRWIAWHSGKGHAWAYWTERQACERADRWLAGGGWQKIAAAEPRVAVPSG